VRQGRLTGDRTAAHPASLYKKDHAVKTHEQRLRRNKAAVTTDNQLRSVLATKTSNGSSAKTVRTDVGDVRIDVPRDRDGTFTPQIVPKYSRRIGGFDETIISLYAKGMTTGEIQAHLEDIYQARVSRDMISKITDKVVEYVVGASVGPRVSGRADRRDSRQDSRWPGC
jgi:hypothetical protein